MSETSTSGEAVPQPLPQPLPKVLSVAAILSLLAGIAVGLLALAGPVGVWLGMSDFRAGFGFLRSANNWSGWVALVAALVAVLTLAVGKQRGAASAGRLSTLAAVGALAALLVWYVPQTFRPPEGTPAIHDIATDPHDPLAFIAIAPLRADAPNNMDYGVMPGVDTVQQHIDMQLEAYPDIVPQRFERPAEAVFESALNAAKAMGWEIVAADAATGRIEATDTTFWFHFKDDVVVEVTESADGAAVLQARSLSRVGRSDVGKNAARLREFFDRVRG